MAAEMKTKTTHTSNIVAMKTIDLLQTIGVAEVILREKFQNNSNKWLDAVFYALMMKNKVYVLEEKSVTNGDSFESLCTKIIDLFSEFQPNSRKSEFKLQEDGYGSLINASYSFVNVFGTFMNLLNSTPSRPNFSDLIVDLKQVEKSIQTFISTNEKRHQRATSEGSQPRSYAVPKDFTDRVATGFELRKKSESVSSHDGSSFLHGLEFRSRSKNDLVCPECNAKITVFNNDVDFSLSLHSQDSAHKKAVKNTEEQKRKASSASPQFVKNLQFVRKDLDSKINEHSAFIEIVTHRDFYCKLCKCEISSLQNVEAHVEGQKHIRNYKEAAATPSDGIFEVAESKISVLDLC